MDQFSKVADGVALFLAVGRPGAKFQACFALLSSPHHVSGKRCKTYFSQKQRRILPTCCVLKVAEQVYSTFLGQLIRYHLIRIMIILGSCYDS